MFAFFFLKKYNFKASFSYSIKTQKSEMSDVDDMIEDDYDPNELVIISQNFDSHVFETFQDFLRRLFLLNKKRFIRLSRPPSPTSI